MITTTEGIVLKTLEFAEADLIVTYLTTDRGIIKSFAKSPRKTRSRFGSSLEPLTHVKLTLWGKEQSMLRITQSDILNSFYRLREDFRDFTNLSRLSEILISFIPEGTPNRKLFDFFLNMMSILQSPDLAHRDALHLIFQIRLLSLLGYAPHLKACGKCGAGSLDFFPDSGTVLCGKCSAASHPDQNRSFKITGRSASFYSHSVDWQFSTSMRLRPSADTISELSSLLDGHLTRLLNRKLLSSEFLAKV